MFGKSFSSKKRKVQALFLSLIALTAVATLPKAAFGIAVLSVEPSSIIDQTLTPGSSFSVDINITNVANLYGVEFKLSFNPTVLMGLGASPGNFWINGSTEWINTIDPSGFVWYSVTRPFGETQGLSGNGTLAVIDFTVNGLGRSNLVVYDELLGDPFANPITHDLAHGYFANSPEGSFTFSPTEPLENEVITFNASASASFEPNGNITNYRWNFGDGNVTNVAGNITNLPSSIITHAYSLSGQPVRDFVVNLTVTDNLSLNASVTKIVTVESPGIHVSPTSGPVGTKVLVRGVGFPPNQFGALFFDDQNLNYEMITDNDGRFNATFNVPLSEPGQHQVKVLLYFYGLPNFNSTTFTVVDVTPLEVNVDVGQIHFKGEIAQFYIQTVFKGTPVDVITRKATLYKPTGAPETLTMTQVATGLYRASYTIPLDASTGTYALVAEASYLSDVAQSKGSSMKTFLLSSTLDGWNAWLLSINGTVWSIKTDIGIINVNMDSINTTMVDVDGKIATIETDIGTIKTTLAEWTGTVASITTGQGATYKILVLTTSEFTGSKVSVTPDYTVNVYVTGTTGTSGTLHLLVPKQLLSDISSSLSKIEIIIDGSKVAFTSQEQAKVYLLNVGYTHSTHTIQVFLTGAPAAFPWTWVIVGLVAAAAAAVILGFLWRRHKAKVAPAPSKQATSKTGILKS